MPPDYLAYLNLVLVTRLIYLVRCNKFKYERFAEYVLVGTLLSVLAALGVASWIRTT